MKSPFKWWKEHAQLLPYLSRLTRWDLVMPGTSVPVEFLFSVTGQVVTAKRASFDPHTVPLLMFLLEVLLVVRDSDDSAPVHYGDNCCVINHKTNISCLEF